MTRKVSIIVLNWNRFKDTKETLLSLVKTNLGDFEGEVILVDNNSSDGSVSKIQKSKSKYQNDNLKLKIIENKENLGFAAGNNVGIQYALDNGADYILILNNDVEVHKNFILEMMKNFESGNKVGAISPKIYFAKGFEFHKDRYKDSDLGKVIWYAGGLIDWDNVYGTTRGVDEVDIGQHNSERLSDYATGTCFLIPREVVEKVGMFDEKYFMYYEDTDLSQRIKRAGYRVMYEPDAIIWHKVAQSSGIGSGLNDYFTTRNRMLFGFKYAKARTKFALVRESLRLLIAGREWQKKGIRDFYTMRFGKGSWRSK